MATSIKTRLDNEDEFTATIDQYGDILAEIDALTNEAASLKSMLEFYANGNGIRRQVTGRYAFAMKRDAPKLNRMDGISKQAIVDELNRSEIGKAYVQPGYDSSALKRDFGGTAAGRDQLEAFGLYLSDTSLHAEVKKRD